jgi:hypothetical protein
VQVRRFDEKLFKANAALPQVKMIELKLSQVIAIHCHGLPWVAMGCHGFVFDGHCHSCREPSQALMSP